jgi:hypothetical protein
MLIDYQVKTDNRLQTAKLNGFIVSSAVLLFLIIFFGGTVLAQNQPEVVEENSQVTGEVADDLKKEDTIGTQNDSSAETFEETEASEQELSETDTGLFSGWSILLGVQAFAPDVKVTYKGSKTQYGQGGWGDPGLAYGASGSNNFFGDSIFGFQHMFKNFEFEAHEENENKEFDENIKIATSGFMYAPALFIYFGNKEENDFFKIAGGPGIGYLQMKGKAKKCESVLVANAVGSAQPHRIEQQCTYKDIDEEGMRWSYALQLEGELFGVYGMIQHQEIRYQTDEFDEILWRAITWVIGYRFSF